MSRTDRYRPAKVRARRYDAKFSSPKFKPKFKAPKPLVPKLKR